MVCRPTVWRDWSEWRYVFDTLRSDDRTQRKRGVQRVAAWRTRGKVPVAVCATASLVEVSLLDTEESPISPWCLRQLYSMALIRLINALADTAQRGKFALSIESLLRTLEWPAWLVDLRHQATHGELPSLEILRIAGQTALSKLHERFWLPQQEVIEENENLLVEEAALERQKIRKLVTKICATPQDENIVTDIAQFCQANTRRAMTIVTAVVDKTIESGDMEPMQVLCLPALLSHTQGPLLSLQKVMRQRLLLPKTPISRIQPFCDLFQQHGIEGEQWQMLANTVGRPVQTSTSSKALVEEDTSPKINVPKRLPERNPVGCPERNRDDTSKRQKTCSATLPWMPIGYKWSWDMAGIGTLGSYNGDPITCSVHDEAQSKRTKLNNPYDTNSHDEISLDGDISLGSEDDMDVDTAPAQEKDRILNVDLLPSLTSF